MLRTSQFAKPDELLGITIYRALRDKVLTEKATDVALDFLLTVVKLKWLPFGLGNKLVRRVLDPLVPEKLLALVKHLILWAGLATEQDFLRMDSPMRVG